MGNVVFEEVIIVFLEHPLVALEGTPAGDRYTMYVKIYAIKHL